MHATLTKHFLTIYRYFGMNTSKFQESRNDLFNLTDNCKSVINKLLQIIQHAQSLENKRI